MEENTEKSQRKYTEAENRYKDTLYKSAYAIRKELEPGLRQFVEMSGAPSVSGMITLLAKEPQRCAEALKSIFAEMANDEPNQRRRLKTTMKSITDELKSGEVSADEIAAAIAAIKAGRVAK
jgi:hypothetical protein